MLAGFVKGAIGLGLPTVSIGLLGLMMTPAQAAAIMVAPALITNVWQASVGGGLLPLHPAHLADAGRHLHRHLHRRGLAAGRQ